MEDSAHRRAGAGCECLGGHRGCRLRGREGQPRHPPAPFPAHSSSVVQPRLGPSQLTRRWGHTPAPGQWLFSFGSFLCQQVGRAGGGPGPVWMVTCSWGTRVSYLLSGLIFWQVTCVRALARNPIVLGLCRHRNSSLQPVCFSLFFLPFFFLFFCVRACMCVCDLFI